MNIDTATTDTEHFCYWPMVPESRVRNICIRLIFLSPCSFQVLHTLSTRVNLQRHHETVVVLKELKRLTFPILNLYCLAHIDSIVTSVNLKKNSTDKAPPPHRTSIHSTTQPTTISPGSVNPLKHLRFAGTQRDAPLRIKPA